MMNASPELSGDQPTVEAWRWTGEHRIPHAALQRPPWPPGPARARGEAALPLPPRAALRGARLAAPPRLPRRDRRAVALGPVAARPLGEEPEGVQGGLRRSPRRRPPGRHRARPAGARHDVDADPAPDGEHDARAGSARRSGPPLHGAGVQRARAGVAEPPHGIT